jgi:hypothetical protein
MDAGVTKPLEPLTPFASMLRACHAPEQSFRFLCRNYKQHARSVNLLTLTTFTLFVTPLAYDANNSSLETNRAGKWQSRPRLAAAAFVHADY